MDGGDQKWTQSFRSLGTLKSPASQEWNDQLGWFLHTDTNLRKLKNALIIIGWAWSEMGKTL